MMQADDTPSAPEALVLDFVEQFLNHPGADEATMRRVLVRKGISREDAWLLVQFAPTAFCRVALRSSGVAFLDSYLSYRPDPRVEIRRLFKDQAIYAAACRVAEVLIANGFVHERVIPIAAGSAEFNALKQLDSFNLMAALGLAPKASGGWRARLRKLLAIQEAEPGVGKLDHVRLTEPILFEYEPGDDE